MSRPPALPTIHIRPERGWLNDANGVTRYAGRWHVFYQHNPRTAAHGDIHWGHVSSPDLVRWQHHRVAFGPTPGGPDSFGCWSGVFVPGLERPAVVYSGVVDETHESTVCLRWALDEQLDEWSEPMVVAVTPDDGHVQVMRDPFVFTVAGRRFALLGATVAEDRPAALLYDCQDMLSWRYLGVWLDGSDPVATGLGPATIWECPQLVHVDGAWVLVLSLQDRGRLDRVVWLAGRLEDRGGRPHFVPTDSDLFDDGPLVYAPQCVQPQDHDVEAAADESDSAPLAFGWIRQEPVPDEAPGRPGVSGCLTLPRRLRREGARIVSEPDPACESLLDVEEWVAEGPGTKESAAARVEAAAQAGGAEVVTRPEDDRGLLLPSAGRVEILGSRGAGDSESSEGPDEPVGARFVGAEEALELFLPVGSVVWVDGDVLEAYPSGPGGTPYATRQEGTRRWRLSTPAEVRVRAVAAQP